MRATDLVRDGPPGGDRLGAAAAPRASADAPALIRARRDADRQRRHRHQRRASRRNWSRRACARRTSACATASWPHVGRLHPDRAVSRSRDRGVARAAGAGDGDARAAIRSTSIGAARAPARCAGRSTRAIAAPTTTSSPRSRERDVHGDATIAYTLDTKRARTEVRAQTTQGPLLRELVRSASNDTEQRRADRPHAVPAARAGRDGAVPRRHDRDGDRARRGTAGIPWELLDTDAERAAATAAVGDPLQAAAQAAHGGLSRSQVVDADADDSILVIGEPECDSQKLPAPVPAHAPRRTRSPSD